MALTVVQVSVLVKINHITPRREPTIFACLIRALVNRIHRMVHIMNAAKRSTFATTSAPVLSLRMVKLVTRAIPRLALAKTRIVPPTQRRSGLNVSLVNLALHVKQRLVFVDTP